MADEKDEIDQLIDELSKTPNWDHGYFDKVDLPSTAPTKSLVEHCFQVVGFPEGHIHDFQILQEKHLPIPGATFPQFTVVLTTSNLGKKIVLAAYRDPSHGWWTRVYPSKVPPSSSRTLDRSSASSSGPPKTK